MLEEYRGPASSNILALGGDPPDRHREYPPRAGLRARARRAGARDRRLLRSAWPPTPSCTPVGGDRGPIAGTSRPSWRAADFGITQFFFEAGHYLEMVDELRALGCDTPVLPGIMPVTNAQVQRFAQLPGAAFPDWLAEQSHAVADEPAEVRKIGIEVATQLCAELLAPARPACTSTRSTAPPRPARSGPTSGSAFSPDRAPWHAIVSASAPLSGCRAPRRR